MALGSNARASSSNGIAIGSGASVTADDSVALGSGSIANEANTISIGSALQQRRITNVAPGRNPTDAVNLGQLNDMQHDTRVEARRGIAGSVASRVNLQPSAPGKTTFGLGMGHYLSETAVGLGVAHWLPSPNNSRHRILIQGGASMSETGSEGVYSMGVGFEY